MILGVDDEEGLRRWAASLGGAGVRLAPFHEPDMGGQMTAIAIHPGEDPRLFRRLRLL